MPDTPITHLPTPTTTLAIEGPSSLLAVMMNDLPTPDLLNLIQSAAEYADMDGDLASCILKAAIELGLTES